MGRCIELKHIFEAGRFSANQEKGKRKMYRVFVNEKGVYMAVRVGANPRILDTTNSFQTDDWELFTSELRHRLNNETSQVLRETSPGKERRKGATKVPFTY